MNPDVFDFLAARLNEREERALRAKGDGTGRWTAKADSGGEHFLVVEGANGYKYDIAKSCGCCYEGTLGQEADHMALNDPEYVLADIAAKRDILMAYQGALTQLERDPDNAGQKTYVAAMSRAVQALCAPFVKHPDCQPRWRPW